MDPTSTGALYEQGLDWERQGDHLAALRYFAETLRLNPEEHRARRRIGACLASLDLPKQAIAVLTVAAEALTRRGLWLWAIASVREALEIDSEDLDVRAALGRIYDAFTSENRRTSPAKPPRAPQPVSMSAKDSVVLARPEKVAARAVEIATAYDEERFASSAPPPIFSELSRAAFLALVPRVALRRVSAGEELASEGEEASGAWIVVAGDVERARRGPAGPNAVFAEMSLVASHAHAETIVAATDVELLEISARAADELVRSHPSFAAEIAEAVKKTIMKNVLERSPLFAALSAEARLDVLRAFETRSIKAGASIIAEGAPASGLYLIGAGIVQITRAAADGFEHVAAFLGEGEVFGEIALLAGRPASATAIAVEETMLLHLDRARFDVLVERQPEVRAYLADLASERMSENRVKS